MCARVVLDITIIATRATLPFVVICSQTVWFLIVSSAIYCLLICTMPVACAILIVYIEHGERGAKDPYGSLAHSVARSRSSLERNEMG